MHTTAIIAAGGRGRRLGAAVPKQLLTVGGTPMLELSVRAFAGHPRVDSLVVVLPPELV
ncbi:MAG: 2-C-methyl-D-erythritol 4-phosphate cytidylyltransferase, partial [Bacteroidales bacterium]